MVRVLPGEGDPGLEEDRDKGAVAAGEEWQVREPGLARAESVSVPNAGLPLPIKLPYLVFR
jgi:hypothetical protein